MTFYSHSNSCIYYTVCKLRKSVWCAGNNCKDVKHFFRSYRLCFFYCVNNAVSRNFNKLVLYINRLCEACICIICIFAHNRSNFVSFIYEFFNNFYCFAKCTKWACQAISDFQFFPSLIILSIVSPIKYPALILLYLDGSFEPSIISMLLIFA